MNTLFKGPKTIILGSKQVKELLCFYLLWFPVKSQQEGNRDLVEALSGHEDKFIVKSKQKECVKQKRKMFKRERERLGIYYYLFSNEALDKGLLFNSRCTRNYR